MSKYYYDPETDTWLVVRGDNTLIYTILFLLVAAPFALTTIFLEKYAEFVMAHKLGSTAIFLVISIGIALLMYHNRDVKGRGAGVIGAVLSIIPVWIAQLFHAIPYVLNHESVVAIAIEWLITAAISWGLSLGANILGIELKSGVKHLWIGIAYTAIMAFVCSFG